MHLTDAEFQILSHLTDDDYFLWESEWDLDALYPEQCGAVNRRLTKVVLRKLFESGLVEACWFDDRLRLIGSMTVTEFYAELEKAANWDPEEPLSRYVQCTTTDSGWQVYDREFRARLLNPSNDG